MAHHVPSSRVAHILNYAGMFALLRWQRLTHGECIHLQSFLNAALNGRSFLLYYTTSLCCLLSYPVRWDFEYFLNLRHSCWVEVTAQFWFQLIVFGRKAQTSVVSQNQLWDGTEKLNRSLPSVRCLSGAINPQILNHNSFSMCYLGEHGHCSHHIPGGCQLLYRNNLRPFPFLKMTRIWEKSHIFF